MNKIIRYTAIAYLVYLGLALLVVTPLLNVLPHKFLRDNYQRELDTGWVWFNPFTLSLEVREAALAEPSGEPFVSFGAASVNLSLASIWHEGIVFDRLRLDQLDAHVQRLATDRFNFSDFIPEPDPDAPPEPETAPDDSAPLGITVGDLHLQAAVIKVTDQAREEHFSTQWENLEIHAVDFSTVLREGKPYRLTLADESGGTLHWEGNVSIAEANSQGALTLSGLRLRPFWRFAKPWLAFELRDGQLDAQTNYSADWRDAPVFSLSDAGLRLHRVDIVPAAGVTLPDTALGLAALDISGITLDSTDRTATIERVAIDTLDVKGFSEGADVSLQTLFTPSFPAGAEGDDSATDAPDAPWTASIATVALSDSRVHWRSEFTEPAVAELEGIGLTLKQLRWPLAGQSPIALEATLNDKATLAIDGGLDLASGDGQFEHAVEGLILPWFNPALPAALQAEVTGGELTTRGATTLSGFAPTQVTLDADIQAFGLRQNEAEQQFTGWNALELDALALDFANRSVVLNKLTVDALTGRVHIARDGTLNTANLWQAPAEDAAATAPADNATQPEGDATASADANAEANADTTAPWSIDIPTVQLRKATIDFQDDSLPIGFRTLVGDLTGFIEGLSSSGQSSAKVDIKGSVDGYAPVSLAGTLAPLQSPPSLDLKLRFDGVDLARVTPYSGTYAGYAIDRGLLDLDLAYTLNDNRLVGKNSVVIDQLKLGERVESDKALDIPLKLGISLLTNANGVIDMKVPVSGNLDDPSFSLGGVIASAFINLITKAVTAPFSLLANLVSSDEDLQYINFAPGQASLQDAAGQKLSQLAQALAQRPALTLALTGRVHPTEDRTALQQAALDEALLADGITRDSIDNRDDAWAAALRKRSALQPNADGSPHALQEHLQAARGAFTIDDAQLLALAEARATAAKAYLLNEAGLAPDRAVIEKASLENHKRDFNGVKLKLEN